MKHRPILVAVIGYIIGILWGLYFQFSIVLYYIPMIVIYYISKRFFKISRIHSFKLLSIHRYSRYLKLMINYKVILIFIFFSIVSNTVVIFQNQTYELLYEEGQNIQAIGKIVSEKIEKEYYNLYQIKLIHIKSPKLYIQVNKNIKLEYGDEVQFQGKYKKPSGQRNYQGYDDKQYLKILKIIGRVKVNQIQVLRKRAANPVLQIANSIRETIKHKIEIIFDDDKADILKGLLLGETEQIEEDIKEGFKIANISHILAISGMHISYLIIGIKIAFEKRIGKRKTRIMTIILLIIYTFITGFSPSVIRAVSMQIVAISSKILYRKNDLINSLAISLLGTLIYHPFLILHVGLQLSYLGTIGIFLLKPNLSKILDSIFTNKKKLKEKSKLVEKIKEMLAVSLSAQIMILPIMLYHFNIIGIYFLVTNLLVGFIIGPILILTFFCILFSVLILPIGKLFSIFINLGLDGLFFITKIEVLPFSKIYFSTPNWIAIVLYFIGILFSNFIYKIYHTKNGNVTYKRIKNLIALFFYKWCQKKKKYIQVIFISLVVIILLSNMPKNLKVYFVDVGQGDCTFVITPQNKTVLIDGGGSLTKEFNVGKKILIPYLFDRGYTSIDYVMISHFDQDHVRWYYGGFK